MKELLYKQLKLAAHPMTFVFPVLCAAMIFIPSYPYSVCFFYVTLGIFFMFQNAREQRDNDFSALLPVRKGDTVRCAVLFSCIVQLASILLTAGMIFLTKGLLGERSNLAGIDANISLLAVGFVVFAVFNGIFLPSFYKTGYKVGTAFLKANVGALFVVIADVILPHVVPWLDGKDSRQLIVLAVSAVVYAIVTWFACRRSVALFEKVDL